MKLYIVDAFTEALFGGNPAGVCLIPEGQDFPDDEMMQKIAAELRYSETAFAKRIPQDKTGPQGYEVRYFTPTGEVDLCGHATVATFYCLTKESLDIQEPATQRSSGELHQDSTGKFFVAHTKAGDIQVDVCNDEVWMDMATPRHIATIDDPIEIDRLYDIMGSEFDQSLALYPMIISTGLPDIIMPVSSPAELNRMAPNMDALTELSNKYGVTGVHAFAFPDSASQGEQKNATLHLHARNFAPACGIPEEAATGTANGALTYYMYLNKKLDDLRWCRVIQGESMGRPSIITTSFHKGISAESSEAIASTESAEADVRAEAAETDITIRVGGNARILAEGDLTF